ncbi:MAG: SIS domain-containing protein, partial [bacterium]
TAMRYDGTRRKITDSDILHTSITTRDIDRSGNPHFFLKEVSEAPRSIDKTIKGRIGIHKEAGGNRQVFFNLGQEIIPADLAVKMEKGEIRNIYFIGQGTAGVACEGIAGIFSDIFKGLPKGGCINVENKNSSEFSGFCLKPDMSDTLVVAVSQSGSTTDTNRAVDLAREKKAFTIAIVNRRDSDITTKVNGVFYTSDGRDIEMSVASTKAFYSQITGGYLLALYFARSLGMPEKELIACVREISRLSGAIEQVLKGKEAIREAAERLALIKRYWAIVGSGPNKVAADEIRIKLSELCYKTISSDVVEDKKHIDLSAEPLIIVCAAGANENVIGDIVKDVAIFKAHGAVPVVIASTGEKRFDKVAYAVLPAPEVGERLAPVLNTVVGHLWGYYAACAIDNESKRFSAFYTQTAQAISRFKSKGKSVYELISDRDYQTYLKKFSDYFTARRSEGKFASVLEVKTCSELSLLLKYMEGKLPLWECKDDFPFHAEQEAVDLFLSSLDQAVNELSRPIDAIKHQAKTVTVGTSRLIHDLSGSVFEEIKAQHCSIQQVSNLNIASLKRIQAVLEKVTGSSLYQVTGLDYHGVVSDHTMVKTVSKLGIATGMRSRADKGTNLKGTKKMVMRTGEAFIGTGKTDDADIIIFPFQPDVNGETYLLLLHIAFQEQGVSLSKLIYALGDKYDDIKDTFIESNHEWNDEILTRVSVRDLFIRSDEAISDLLANGGIKHEC